MKNNPNDGITPNDAERISASLKSKESKIFALRKLSKWFEMDISIKIFGVEIFHWHFPPIETPSETASND